MPVIKSEMMLPMAMAPRVVAAEILKELERECNVIIKLDQDNATAKGSPKKQVACDRVATINGTGPDVAFCKYRIFELMMGQPPPVSMFAPKDAEGNKSMQILIPAIRVGLVIGRGGETIKYLQETTGCRVSMTPETAADSNHQTRAVTVSGSEAAIQHAKKLIEDITGGPVEFQEGDAYVTEIIKVPNDRVGLIIGKGGETIKMIQKECNVKLNIEQQPDDNLERALSITGTKENVQFATEAVYERVAGRRGNLGGQEQYTYSYETPQYAYGAVQQPAVVASFDADYAAIDGQPAGEINYDSQAYAEWYYANYDPNAAAAAFDPASYDPSQQAAYEQYALQAAAQAAPSSPTRSVSSKRGKSPQRAGSPAK